MADDGPPLPRRRAGIAEILTLPMLPPGVAVTGPCALIPLSHARANIHACITGETWSAHR